VRSFAPKKKKGRKADQEASDNESQAEEDHADSRQEESQDSQVHSAPLEDLNLDKELYQPFSLGDVRQIDSTPDHQPPSKEDTIGGRYATVLFTTAS